MPGFRAAPQTKLAHSPSNALRTLQIQLVCHLFRSEVTEIGAFDCAHYKHTGEIFQIHQCPHLCNTMQSSTAAILIVWHSKGVPYC